MKEGKNDQFCRALGRRVEQLREERSLSHRSMVEGFGLHLGQLHKLEEGESVHLHTVVKLCAVFNMTMAELMEGVSL